MSSRQLPPAPPREAAVQDVAAEAEAEALLVEAVPVMAVPVPVALAEGEGQGEDQEGGEDVEEEEEENAIEQEENAIVAGGVATMTWAAAPAPEPEPEPEPAEEEDEAAVAEREREARLARVSRALAYLLRHHESKKRTRGGHWFPYISPGGWYRVTDVLTAQCVRWFSSADLEEAARWSMSDMSSTPRFAITNFCETHQRFDCVGGMDVENGGEGVEGVAAAPPAAAVAAATTGAAPVTVDREGCQSVRVIRACYGHSFDPSRGFDEGGKYDGEVESVPSLATLCTNLIVENIKHIPDIGELGDEFLLDELFQATAKRGKMTNRVLRYFAVESCRRLDLSRFLPTDSALNYVLRNSPNLVELNVAGGLVVTDHMLGQILRRLPLLEFLDVSKCSSLTATGFADVIKQAAPQNLRILVTYKLPYVDRAMMDDLLASIPSLQEVKH